MDIYSPPADKNWRDSSLNSTVNCTNGYQQSDSSFDSSITSPYSSHTNDNQVYYGIYFAPDSDSVGKFKETVFTDKAEALRIVKQNKNARFRAFYSELEALEFSKSGGEVIAIGSPSSSGESSLYKGPKSQELVKFRKAIENNDINLVKQLIDENPRYLIGSGDTPTILQEGSRYNALHIAARAYVSNICSYILCTISDTSFLGRLYGQNNSSLQERRNMLVDLYLNTPDKGSNETPLHFACKLGALEIVKILTSYTQCDKLRRNKSGFTPSDIACSRAPENMVHNKQEILKLLDTQYFIPVLRSADNSLPPVIGEPFTNSNPPTIEEGRITPPLEVQAVAGPMTKEQAQVFRKKWKTPPRLSNSPIVKQRPELSDPEKGLEKIGRILANEFGVQWKEYWPFLKSFQDLASDEGLNALENFLKERFMLANNDKFLCNHSGDNSKTVFCNFKSKPLPFLCDSPLNSYIKNRNTTVNSRSSDYSENQVICDLTEEFSKLRIASPQNMHLEANKSSSSNSGDSLNLSMRNDSPLIYNSHHNVLNNVSPINKEVQSRLICRTLFSDENNEEKTSSLEENNGEGTSDKNEMNNTNLIDEALSDDEFFTAPNSPDLKFTFPLPPYEDEDSMQPAECGPEVYLTGNAPSKIDKAVLDALEQVPLSVKSYPYIVMWKLSCQQLANK